MSDQDEETYNSGIRWFVNEPLPGGLIKETPIVKAHGLTSLTITEELAGKVIKVIHPEAGIHLYSWEKAPKRLPRKLKLKRYGRRK